MAEELKRAGIGCPYCGNDLYVDFDMCPHCGHAVPKELLKLIQAMRTPGSTQNPTQTSTQSIDNLSLTHFEDLEEDSKTKIGTFERLLADQYADASPRGFNDTDYAPLVNLLASVLEVELAIAIYDKFIVYWQNLEGPEKLRESTLGSIGYLLNRACIDEGKLLPDSVKDNWRFAESKFGRYCGELRQQLSALTKARNDAAHKMAISKQDFQAFFSKYQPFYEQYMPAILELKKRGDSQGYRLFVDLRKNFPTF